MNTVNTLPSHDLLKCGYYETGFLNEYGRLEVLRSARYNRSFSLILIEFENPAAPGWDKFFMEVSTTLLKSIRDCDIPGFTDDGKIAVILTETDHFGSLSAIRKINRLIDPIRLKGDRDKNFIIAQATFPKDARTFKDLLSAASKRLDERKKSIIESLRLKDKLFWEIMGEIMGQPRKDEKYANFDAGSGEAVSEFFMDRVNELVINELQRWPAKKGILYFATKKISSQLPFVKSLHSIGPVAAKVFLVGEGNEEELWDIKAATPICIDDPRMKELSFTFFLNEDTAYAIIFRESWGGVFSCFHTSDRHLVEAIINKFQKDNSLQEQLG